MSSFPVLNIFSTHQKDKRALILISEIVYAKLAYIKFQAVVAVFIHYDSILKVYLFKLLKETYPQLVK